MPKLWEAILNTLNFIGDNSGCHQIPDRCFTVRGYTFPLCSRCTGILLSLPFALAYGTKNKLKALHFILLLPMFVDWLLTQLKITKGTNYRRFITGFLGGFAVYVIQVNLLKIIYKMIRGL